MVACWCSSHRRNNKLFIVLIFRLRFFCFCTFVRQQSLWIVIVIYKPRSCFRVILALDFVLLCVIVELFYFKNLYNCFTKCLKFIKLYFPTIRDVLVVMGQDVTTILEINSWWLRKTWFKIWFFNETQGVNCYKIIEFSCDNIMGKSRPSSGNPRFIGQ